MKRYNHDLAMEGEDFTMNNESHWEGRMRHARVCQQNIDYIDGVPINLPEDMTAQDLVSIDLSSRHQRKWLDSITWAQNKIEGAFTKLRRIE